MGIINFGRGTSFRSITIAGVTYVQDGDDLRPATAEEIAELEARRAAKAAAKAAARETRQPAGPDIVIGDVAGRDIIRTHITIRTDGD